MTKATIASTLCLFGPALAFAPHPAWAKDAAEESPPSIIITGTRADSALEDEPYTVSAIDLEELERALPRTVPEALQSAPGVLVQKTASGHGSPYIRGFTGNRTLLVIDGIRYNNANFRDGANEYFAQVDSFTLAQIELISGPSSALYGSEAVGGVINLTTRASSAFGAEGFAVSGEQTLRISSGDASIVSRSALDIGEGGRWGLRGGVTLREYGDVRAAELGRLPKTGYSEHSFDARLDVALSPRWSATLFHQNLQQDDVPRTHSTVFSVPFAGTAIGTDLVREKDHHRTLTYAKLRGGGDASWLRSTEITISHQSRRDDELRIRGDNSQIDQGFTSDMFALSLVNRAELGELELTYGVDLSRENIDSARTDTSAQGVTVTRLQGPVGTDARYDQAGAFVRGQIQLSEAWIIEAGLRGSLVEASVGQFADPITNLPISFTDSWSDLSGSLRAQYSDDRHRFWGAYSRSFRAPNIADISRFGRSRSSEIEVASIELDPERFETFELGYGFTANRLNFSASAYTTRLIDYIATVPTGELRDGLTEVAKRNAASGRISGVEIGLEAALSDEFTLNGNATWLRGRLTTPTIDAPLREPISRIQPLSGNVSLAWERDSQWALLELGLFDRADELSSGDFADVERIPPGGTPGYALLNLRAGTKVAERLSLSIAFNNLLNEAYRAHGSGNNEPGRHVTLGVSLEL